jgi:hypothetical protein
MRGALDSDQGEGNWTAFSGALERRLLRTDRYLAGVGASASASTEKKSPTEAVSGSGGKTSDGDA